MRAHCVRARFRDRSRASFIACSFNFQGSDRCRARMTVSRALRVAREGELLTTLSRRGQGGSFRCKTVSTASVRKGAMTRRRASTATLFSQQNENHSAEPAFRPSSIWTEDPTCANHVDVLTVRSVFFECPLSTSSVVSRVDWKACA